MERFAFGSRSRVGHLLRPSLPHATSSLCPPLQVTIKTTIKTSQTKLSNVRLDAAVWPWLPYTRTSSRACLSCDGPGSPLSEANAASMTATMSFTVEAAGDANPLCLDSLLRALQSATSLDHIQRQSAGQQLSSWEQQPGYYSSLQVQLPLSLPHSPLD